MKILHQSPTDPAFVQNPYPLYDSARLKGPVLYWQDYDMPAVFDAATVQALLRDRRLGREPITPRNYGAHMADWVALEHNSMLELEPPRHSRLRGLVLRAFTSRRIAALRPDIEDHLVAAGIKPTERAEQVSLEQFCALARSVKAAEQV